MPDSYPGNSYEPAVTDKGIPTFRHRATGEFLHGQAGPWQEAWNLYIHPSRMAEHAGDLVVHDVGMGCAAQLFAAYEAFQNNPRLRHLHVVSFDLEKGGLTALQTFLERFPHLMPYADLLGAMLLSDQVERTLPDGRTFTWQFVGGDYQETLPREAARLAKANLIFYDFFSPASHSPLWTFRMFEHVFAAAADDARLMTYSCATAVRAALAASGFFVGYGIASGKKARTTVAARRFTDLAEPLPPQWLTTFQRSHIPFLEAESAEDREKIRHALASHPQFRAAGDSPNG